MRIGTLRLLAGLAVLAGLATLQLEAARAEEPAETDAVPAVQYRRIGVVPFKDESRTKDGGAQFTEMLAGRLGGLFPEAEFVLVDPTTLGIKSGPLLLEEAVELGAEYEVEALLDGVFGGVEIVGGTWPNRGSDSPQARGFLSWRLVECGEGLLVIDGKIKPKRPKVYSQRIRDSEELIDRVMQDLVAEVGQVLADQALIVGTEPKTEDAAAPSVSDEAAPAPAEGES